MQEMLYDRTHEWHSTPLETVALIAMLIGIVLVVRTFSGTPVGIIFACVAFLGYIFDAHLYIPAAISIAIMCTWVSWWRSGQSPDKLQHPWPKLLLDMFIAGGGFLLYELGRVATNNGESRGMENAERMIAVQNWLHLPDEAAFQQFIISDDFSLRAVNKIYSFFFLSTVIGILVWLYLNRPAVYRRVRNALGLSTLIAIAIFALVPMAPPRLTPASNMIDSHARVGSRHGFVNQFAALPSLHIGWLTLVGWGMWKSLHRVPGALFAIVPASVMMIAVVATGNHYWLDGVVGSAICLGAVMSTGPQPDPVSTPAPSVPVRLSFPALLARRAAGSKHPHPALRPADLYVPRPPARSGFYIVLGIPGRTDRATGHGDCGRRRSVPITSAAQPIDLHDHRARDDRRRARNRWAHVPACRLL